MRAFKEEWRGELLGVHLEVLPVGLLPEERLRDLLPVQRLAVGS